MRATPRNRPRHLLVRFIALPSQADSLITLHRRVSRASRSCFSRYRAWGICVPDLKIVQFQRGAGSRLNQLAVSAPRAKLRRACRQQIFAHAPRPLTSATVHCRDLDHRPRTIPAKPIRIDESPKGIGQSLMTNNVTRHFARTRTGGISSPESPYIVSHHQTIRNYLNQTMPLPTQQHLRERNRVSCQNRGNLVDRSCTSADTEMLNTRVKNAARNQASRLQTRHSFDGGCSIQRRSSTMTCNRSGFLNSHNQNHGVIAASIYKDLCNGTINW